MRETNWEKIDIDNLEKLGGNGEKMGKVWIENWRRKTKPNKTMDKLDEQEKNVVVHQ